MNTENLIKTVAAKAQDEMSEKLRVQVLLYKAGIKQPSEDEFRKMSRSEKLKSIMDTDFQYVAFKKHWTDEEKENNKKEFYDGYNTSGTLRDFWKSQEENLEKYIS
jgi:hypothetical protein